MKSAKAFPLALLLIILLMIIFPCHSQALFSWQPYVPDSIVMLSSGYVIVVDKQAQKLYVFRKGNSIEKVFEAPCSTGKKPGAKKEPGDAKTPNGIFFIQRYYDNTELTSIYGPMAFHLDFPNTLDRRSGRNGTNIWIHGTNKPLQPFQSNGCVALQNKDIEQLAAFIFINKTPVIIEESITWITQDKKPPDRDELERIVGIWDKAVNEADTRTLESLYMTDSREKAEYKPFLQKSSHLRSLIHHMLAAPRDITILKQNDTAVILFDKITSVKSDTSFQGSYVKLFLEKRDNRWFVVEDVQPGSQLIASKPRTLVKDSREAAPLPPQPPVQTKQSAPPKTTAPAQAVPQQTTAQVAVAKAGSSNVQAVQPGAVQHNQPRAVPVQQAEANSSDQAAITRVVEKWADSWQEGNMREYRSCFSSDFRSRGMSLGKYIDYKTDLAKKYRKISVRVSNLKVSYSGGQNATAIFRQTYSAAGGPKTSGVKKLELKKVKEGWRIYRETMSR